MGIILNSEKTKGGTLQGWLVTELSDSYLKEQGVVLGMFMANTLLW
jgi:hypothetical protein